MTTKQVKTLFRRRGITFTHWAEGNSYNCNEVHRILNRRTKARYDKSHEVTMKLELESTAQTA